MLKKLQNQFDPDSAAMSSEFLRRTEVAKRTKPSKARSTGFGKTAVSAQHCISSIDTLSGACT